MARSTNSATASYRDNAEGYGLTKDGMVYFWEQYLCSEEQAHEPYAAPMCARDWFPLIPPWRGWAAR